MELLFPLLLIAVFYFLLIRPQQKQRKQMAEMQQQLGPGSEVMTGAGLIGTVVAIDEDQDRVVLEVAPGVTNTYVRRAIVNVLTSPGTPVDGVDDDGIDDLDVPADERDDLDRALEDLEASSKDGPADDAATGSDESGSDEPSSTSNGTKNTDDTK